MRKLIIGILAAGAMGAGAASAADLPMKAPAFIPAPVPVLSWAGFYVGANVGYGWGSASAALGPNSVSESLDGIVGGGQIGYNFQWAGSPFVVGIEADIQGTDQHRDTVIGTPLGAATFTDRITYFGTLRARLGYAPSNWLFYVTGGLAYGQFESSVTVAGVTVSGSETRAGWTLGGGVEWMFAPRWSAKLEYLYLDSGDFSQTAFGLPYTASLRDNIVRVGVNYHF